MKSHFLYLVARWGDKIIEDWVAAEHVSHPSVAKFEWAQSLWQKFN